MRSPRTVSAIALGLLLLAGPAQAVPGTGAPVTAGKKAYETSLLRWRASGGDFAPWTRAGTALTDAGELRLDPEHATAGTDPFGPGGYRGGTFYNGGSFLVGQATSPVISTPDGFSEAIASWNARTPAGTWIALIRARVNGRFTKLYNLGVWASGSSTVRRHSVRAQGDADGFVAVDTLVLDDKLRGDAFELTFRLFSDTPGAVPTVRSASLALSSGYNKIGAFVPGEPALWDRVLPVPECSQMVYPDGGTVWCSPTSTSMVLAYWTGDTGPCEPRVRAAVDGVYDWVYDGDGTGPSTRRTRRHRAWRRKSPASRAWPTQSAGWLPGSLSSSATTGIAATSPAPRSPQATGTWPCWSASTPSATRS